MAIRVRGTAELANKFKTRAGAAAQDYKSGVEAGGADWEQNTVNAKPAYEAGVQESIAKGRYEKGVRKSGGAHYVKRASELGAQRYPTGVAAGADRWATNTAPYLQALQGMTLPPPGPRGGPQNQARASMVAQELRKLRDSQ